jgi:hypothetical protein
VGSELSSAVILVWRELHEKTFDSR